MARVAELMFDLSVDENDLALLIHQYHAARRCFDGQPKLLLRAFALRDVSQNNGVQLASGDIDLRDRRFRRKLGSVGSETRDRPKGPHFSTRDTGSPEYADMVLMCLPEPLRKELVNW